MEGSWRTLYSPRAQCRGREVEARSVGGEFECGGRRPEAETTARFARVRQSRQARLDGEVQGDSAVSTVASAGPAVARNDGTARRPVR